MLAHPVREAPAVGVHPQFELGVVLRGEIERRVESYVATVEPGEVWLSAAWEPHAWRSTRPNTTEVVCLFAPDFLDDETVADLSWLAPFVAPVNSRPKAKTPELRELAINSAYEMLREVDHRGRGWLDACRLALLRLLLGLTRDWRPPPMTAERGYARPSDLMRLLPAIQLVQSRTRALHGARAVSRADAAAACALSLSRFGWLFQHTMGMSFGAFAMRAKLAIVARKLLSTRMALEAIAVDCGFAHASHLHRLFAKYYGLSPGSFRELGRAAKT